MLNQSNSDYVFERCYIIKKSITHMLEVLRPSGIQKIDAILARADELFEETIVKRNILEEVEFRLEDKKRTIRAIWNFRIDWENHALEVARWDRYVQLQPIALSRKAIATDSHPSLEEISNALNEIRMYVGGLIGYTDLYICKWAVRFAKNVSEEDAGALGELKSSIRAATPEEVDQVEQFKAKNGLLEIGARSAVTSGLNTLLLVDDIDLQR